MTSYLYGASIQGIQRFIFETNKLKEIAGASEIVENLCDEAAFCTALAIPQGDVSFIRSAAGNITLTTASHDIIKKIVLSWPQWVDNAAPGATLSQAVIEVNGKVSMEDMNQLERKLRTQRNKVAPPAELGQTAIIRSRRTGKPAIDWKDNSGYKSVSGVPRSLGSKRKQDAGGEGAVYKLMEKVLPKDKGFSASADAYPFDISDITRAQDKGWVAVIHADGNGLGKIIQAMLRRLADNGKDIATEMKSFSEKLDQSTVEAVKEAVAAMQLNPLKYGSGAQRYPFRPVVVGGDDMTMICRADLAMDFTEQFLRSFELKTAKNLKDFFIRNKLPEFSEGLTACAGIAFMKASYPFHYGIHLAEQLCAEAKKTSKAINEERVPSSLLFHKIQDSFFTDYTDIKERELSPAEGLSMVGGPYGLDNSTPLSQVRRLQELVHIVLEPDAPKSGIRKYLGLLHENPEKANFLLERVCDIVKERDINERYTKELGLKEPFQDGRTHLHDILALASLGSTTSAGAQ